MFTEPLLWDGGCIELLCALGPVEAGLRARVQQAVWSWPGLCGPFSSRTVEPDGQALCDPQQISIGYGVATLPDQRGRVAFQATLVEDADGLWLYAGSPLGSLDRVFPIGTFPFGVAAVPAWERTLHAWLFDLACHLHAELPFQRGVIGWVSPVEVEELAGRSLPDVRYHGYVTAGDHGLQYLPPNRTTPLYA